MIIKLAFAQIWLGILGKAKIEPHVLKEKCFFCIVCDFSRFYHNCTSCGTCSIYFLSSFALHFILFRSIQLKFLRLLKIFKDSFNVSGKCTFSAIDFYQMAKCSYHSYKHPPNSAQCSQCSKVIFQQSGTDRSN